MKITVGDFVKQLQNFRQDLPLKVWYGGDFLDHDFFLSQEEIDDGEVHEAYLSLDLGDAEDEMTKMSAVKAYAKALEKLRQVGIDPDEK